VIPVSVVIAIFVVILPRLVTVPIVPVAISVPIAGPGISPAAVIGVVVIPAAVIAVMIVCVTPIGCIALIVPESRVLVEASFILASPFPIFSLALTVEPVVLHIVIPALCQPLPVIRIVVSVVASGTVIASGAIIRIISPISVLRASGGHDCPQSQS
jgi:hypothetical protein